MWCAGDKQAFLGRVLAAAGRTGAVYIYKSPSHAGCPKVLEATFRWPMWLNMAVGANGSRRACVFVAA